MASRRRARIRSGAKRVLPAGVIRMLRAVRSSVEDQTWVDTSDQMLDPRLRRLAYWPGGRQNPYLKLLYSRVPEVGFVAAPLTRYSDLETLAPDAVFHLHWTRGAQLGATSRREAEAMTGDYLAPIEQFVERGGTLVWSVHEEVPHDSAYPDIEVRLRSRLADLAHGIHTLHRSTQDSVSHLYTLHEDRTFVVEHPLYTGYYPRYLGPSAARKLLGIPEDTALILGFGTIRPYKGFDRLLDVTDDLGKAIGRLVHVIIAGPTMAHADIDRLSQRAGASSNATMSAGPVPEDDVQILFEAADVIALPYRNVMNSGVLMLGLTFGKACVAPRNPITADTVASNMVQLFEAASDDSLAAALQKALTEPTPDELPQEFRHRYDPSTIAGQFAEHLAAITLERGHS